MLFCAYDKGLNGKNLKKFKKIVDNFKVLVYNMSCVTREELGSRRTLTGVWLSLARVLDLGSRGRRFESCHPDSKKKHAGVVQW